MKTALISILFVFTVIASDCQNNDTIKTIEKKCEYINKLNNYKTVTLKNGEFLDETFLKQAGEGYGHLTGYFKNDSIYKISEIIGIKSLKDIGITEYYYWQGKLIYINEKEYIGPDILIDNDGTIEHKTETPDFEGEYYFWQEKIFYKTVKGKPEILPNEMYFQSQSKAGQLITSSEKNIDLLIKKKK